MTVLWRMQINVNWIISTIKIKIQFMWKSKLNYISYKHASEIVTQTVKNRKMVRDMLKMQNQRQRSHSRQEWTKTTTTQQFQVLSFVVIVVLVHSCLVWLLCLWFCIFNMSLTIFLFLIVWVTLILKFSFHVFLF